MAPFVAADDRRWLRVAALAIASVEGEAFTVQIVADVMNLPERSTLRRLSQDLEQRHRLVKEEEEKQAA